MQIENTFAALQFVAQIFGMSIHSANTPDGYLLIDDRNGDALGMGDEWELKDIFGFLKELVEHPEAPNMVVTPVLH